MTHPDDAFDLGIHFDIERLIQVFIWSRNMTRSRVIAEMCSGNELFFHGYEAICVKYNITRAELNDRISAFIEAEKEEEAERLIRAVCEREVDA